MSRYNLIPFNNDHKIVIGWDPPLFTFFAQVKDTTAENEDEEMILWVGTSYREIQDIRTLEDHLGQYAHVPEDIKRKLSIDSD